MRTKTNRLRARYASLSVCLILAAVFTLFAVFAGRLAPFNPLETDYGSMLEAPSLTHPFGTDQLGRDLLSRILYGGQTSLLIAYLVTLIISSVGILLGVVSGQAGGMTDSIIMRLTDVLMAFPGNIFILALVAVMGTGLQNLIIAMCFTGWTKYARVTRSLVLVCKK